MGFLKSLLALFGKSDPAEAPTVQQPHAGADHDDEEEDRTTVMTRKQFDDVTDRITEQVNKKP